jgi:hypothetical protein
MIVANKKFSWGTITVLVDVKDAAAAGAMSNIFHDQHETFEEMSRAAKDTEQALKKRLQ